MKSIYEKDLACLIVAKYSHAEWADKNHFSSVLKDSFHILFQTTEIASDMHSENERWENKLGRRSLRKIT